MSPHAARPSFTSPTEHPGVRGIVFCLLLAGVDPPGDPALAAETWKVEPRAPRGVFLEGAPVEFAWSGGSGAPAATVLDVEGREVGTARVSGDAPTSGSLRLDLPGPGHYRLRLGDGTPPPISFAVLPAAAAGLPGRDGAIASDGAISWLVARPGGGADQDARDCARLAKLAGIGMLRDRIAWGEVEPRPGEFRWGRYDDVATACREAGIDVYQIFHDSPRWSRSDHAGKRMPDDLRSVHRFARAAQERFRGRADWWEPWNEPDIPVFSEDPADQLAAFQKAAYLGFKAADPRSTVLMVSLAHPPGPFIESFLENETGPYFEVYNYHIYDEPEGHVRRARAHIEVCERFGLGDKPLWVTEAGIGIKTPTGDLTHEEAVRQAEFLPKSYVLSLSIGVSRHFFFILPHFIERGVQFGLLEREQRPGPGYVALAALTAALGDAGAPRELRGLPAGLRGWLFARGDGRHAAAIWSEAAAPVALPGASGLEARDLYGRRLEIGADGSLRVPGSTTYLVGQEERFAQWNPSTTAPRIRVAPPDFQLSSVVLRFEFPPDRTDKAREAWRAGSDGALDGRLQVYNFGTTPFDGTIRVSCDRGLEVEPAERPIRVAPDGLESAEIRIRWKEEGDAFRKIRAIAMEPATPGGAERRSSAAVIRLVR